MHTPTRQPISNSFQTYLQRELIELKGQYEPRGTSPGVEVIGGNREISFYPFRTLNAVVETYPQFFDKGHPLAGLGSWQNPTLFRPYAKLPSMVLPTAMEAWSQFQATICKKLALLYITSVKKGSSFHVAQRAENGDFPPVTQWTQLDNLCAGDIVVLSGASIFSTKLIGSLLLTEAGSISCHLRRGFDLSTCTGEHLDATSAGELVVRPWQTTHSDDATVTSATVKGVNSDFIMSGKNETIQTSYTVNVAYALLASRARNLRLKSLHGEDRVLFEHPPSGCIVRGGTTLSISGQGSALILSAPQ